MKHKKLLLSCLATFTFIVTPTNTVFATYTPLEGAKYNSSSVSHPMAQNLSYWKKWRHVVLITNEKFINLPWHLEVGQDNNFPTSIQSQGQDLWIKKNKLDGLSNSWSVKGGTLTDYPNGNWIFYDFTDVFKPNNIYGTIAEPYSENSKKYWSLKDQFHDVILTKQIKATEIRIAKYGSVYKKIRTRKLNKGAKVQLLIGNAEAPWVIRKKGWAYKGWNRANGYHWEPNKKGLNMNWFKLTN